MNHQRPCQVSQNTPIHSLIGRSAIASEPLSFQVIYVRARFISAGNVNPWLGNAIRGMAIRPLRDHFCQLTPRQQQQRRLTAAGKEDRYCKDCSLNAACQYGRVFEPDRRIIDGTVRNGIREGLRSVTIAPEFPIRQQAQPGDVFGLRILAIGEPAFQMAETTLEAIAELGSNVGLGPEKIRFAIEPETIVRDTWSLRPSDLPLKLERGVVPRINLNLLSPIFLKPRKQAAEVDNPPSPFRPISDRAARARQPGSPLMQLEGLLRESIRTVRRAISELSPDRFQLEFDPGELLHAAAAVECLKSNFCLFEQSRISARQDARWKTKGWIGSATYCDFPLALLPWLIWAGRIGTGDSRNCGAGLWDIKLDNF